MWWVIGFVGVVIAAIILSLCVGAGRAYRQLEYIEVRDLDLHNESN